MEVSFPSLVSAHLLIWHLPSTFHNLMAKNMNSAQLESMEDHMMVSEMW